MRRSAVFEHRFRAPPERVFAALGDTSRYNEAAAFPIHTIEDVTLPDGSRRFTGRAKLGPLTVAWEDRPCNWIRGRWFEHERVFSQGPVDRLVASLELEPDGAGGSRGRYRMEVDAHRALGRLALLTAFFPKSRALFHRLADQADAWAVGERAVMFDVPPPRLAEAARERLGRSRDALVAAGHPPALVERLARLVAEGAENDVVHIRPLGLARAWGAAWRPVVELCLDATRHGLLASRWDLLCPRCRAAKAGSTSLDRLPEGAHCSTCAIDYGRDFARNVELSFRPAEPIRPLQQGEFCLLGPMSTPHIVAHLTVQGSGSRMVELMLPPGRYRARTLEPGPEVEVDSPGGPLPSLVLHGDGIAVDGAAAAGTLRNATAATRTFVIEERAWIADALTADRATSLQAFRDLFASDALRPGDQVGIERMTILFTDLRGSTALYDRIGDAGAYARVRDHFAYLGAIVREHDGAIVKTIGDAVMAAFALPADGVRAALAMQQRLASLNSGAAPPLTLKVGVHAGPCIAVTMNERLDYFGSTVNLASRLQGESRGGDVVVSAMLAAEPEVAALLHGRVVEVGRTPLRGFAEDVDFVRLRVD